MRFVCINSRNVCHMCSQNHLHSLHMQTNLDDGIWQWRMLLQDVGGQHVCCVGGGLLNFTFFPSCSPKLTISAPFPWSPTSRNKTQSRAMEIHMWENDEQFKSISPSSCSLFKQAACFFRSSTHSPWWLNLSVYHRLLSIESLQS